MKYIYLVKCQHLNVFDCKDGWVDVEVTQLYETVERWATYGDEYHWLSTKRPVKGRMYLAQTIHGHKVVEVTDYQKVEVGERDPQLYFLSKYSVSLRYLICLLPKTTEVNDKLYYFENIGYKCCGPSSYAWNKLESLFHKKEVKTRKSKPRRISKTEALEMKKGCAQ